MEELLIAILEKEVWIGLRGQSISYYEDLGYKIPRYIDNQGRSKVKKGTEILVNIKNLPLKSGIKVTKICDDCGKHIPNTRFCEIIKRRNKSKKDLCHKCGNVQSGINKKANVKYEKSLECLAKRNNKEYLLKEYSKKNKRSPFEVSYGDNDEFVWDCSTCGSDYTMSLIMRTGQKCGCPYCAGMRVNNTNNLSTLKPEIAKEWHPLLNNISPSEITSNSKKAVWWICKEGHEWEASVSNRTNPKLTSGCPKCAGRNKTHDEFLKRLKINNLNFKSGKFKVIGEYSGSNKRIKCKCNLHNHEWSPIAASLNNGTGCPICNLSRGELKIIDYLNESKIKYTVEKKFKECKNKKSLPFDFYFSKMLLLEFDGEQHFRSKTGFGEDAFESTNTNDKIKNQYCINNNISLIRIPYWEQKNIEYILENVLIHYQIKENKNDSYDKDIVLKYSVDKNWDHDKYITSAPCNKKKNIKNK